MLRLSHKPHLDDQLLAISSHQPAWIQEILDVYQENIEAQDLLVKLAVQISEDDHFSLRDVKIVSGFLLTWTWSPNCWMPFIPVLLGATGIPVTLHRLK